MECEAVCPFCFESVSLWIDVGGGLSQDYVEDCAICCRPCRVVVSPTEPMWDIGASEGGEVGPPPLAVQLLRAQ